MENVAVAFFIWAVHRVTEALVSDKFKILGDYYEEDYFDARFC